MIVSIPSTAGSNIDRWIRDTAAAVNELAAENTVTIFTWNKGCVTVPTSTTISGAEQLVFQSQFTGNGTLVITVFDAEGGVNVALNGVELGALTGTASQEVLYEVPVTNLVEGDNPLNVFKIWSTTGDTAELRKLEVYRNFTREQISDSSIWGNITGTGKPADDATVGATAGTDLKDSGATVLSDADVKNDEQTFDDVSGASKPEDNATVGANNSNLATDSVTTIKVVDAAISKISIGTNGSNIFVSSDDVWTDLVSISFTKDEADSDINVTGIARSTQPGTQSSGKIRLLRDAVEIKIRFIDWIVPVDRTDVLQEVDSPSAATYTYKLQMLRSPSGGASVSIVAGQATLELQELKK